MAYSEIHPFEITTPAGTPVANPQLASMAMPSRIIERIEVLVPPGPRGELGFRFSSGGQPVAPADNAKWIISNDEHIAWEFSDLPDSGAMELTSYNTGTYPHTVYVRIFTSLIPDPTGAPPPPIPPAQLAGNPPPPVPVPPPPAPV